MSADLVLKDGGTIIYTSPSPGVSTAIGDFPGFALMDLMKPYMPPTPENYQRVLHDIHKREIQMWAGCIWVPIYEVMTRKHLTVVTLEENLEMAADIGLDATTSLDEAFAAAMERHGPDAKVAVLPFARYQLPRTRCGWRPTDPSLLAHAMVVSGAPEPRSPAFGRRAASPTATPPAAQIRGSTTILEILRMYPGRARGEADVEHLLAVRPLRRRRPRAADDGCAPPRPRPAGGADAFRALEDGGPDEAQVALAAERRPR